jgi:ABC-type transport system involved in multi-copper enzyme maturation permease subunit
MRLGLGPVFVYESLVNARRWQVYAGRSIFVLVLLLGLVLVWISVVSGASSANLVRRLSEVGEQFFYTIAVIELFLVLLAAPGATAGAICLDRSRGTLTHVLVTDLSDAEIVLGKLAARLAPVIGLVLCALPVVAMATLLGGIDPWALFGSVAVSLAIAVLGCALALAISVRANKAHEVLLVVYMLWAAWLLAVPIWLFVDDATGNVPIPPIPDWFWKANPFVLVFAPYTHPGYAGLEDFAAFIGALLLVAAALVTWTVVRLRKSIAWQDGRVPRTRRRLRLWTRLPGPSLDSHPVLWREWRRQRPSKLTRFVWGLYAVASLGATTLAIVDATSRGIPVWSESLKLVAGLEIAFGLLLVAASAPTALSEERARGSLDVLLATPLRTRSVLLAKWWGVYRIVPMLAILPTLGMTVLAVYVPRSPRASFRAMPNSVVQITTLDRLMVPALTLGQVLFYGAAVVSLGLALATWFKRPARAIATTLTLYILATIAWPILLELGLAAWAAWTGKELTLNNLIWLFNGLISPSPLFGPGASSMGVEFALTRSERVCLWLVESGICLAALILAAGLLTLTVASFDRCLGRISDRPNRRGPLPERQGQIGRAREREVVSIEAGAADPV